MSETKTGINIAKIMTPKVSISVLEANNSVRQGLEMMRQYGYTAVPVLSDKGEYLGSVTEGDFLRHLLNKGTLDFSEMEQSKIADIFRPDFCKPLHMDAPLDQVIDTALEQNFVPIVDDRNCFCGIVTRRSVILHLSGKNG